ncbi:unnamed protein product [Dovyalis caffra]|uniref:VQ domain-containing protein n=1 Tax=Dovyalis caffra TaxID=77055 RepID=A0AAV1ST79_9ROSI|nr:unnamed protein product [Dovyalis caffra]
MTKKLRPSRITPKITYCKSGGDANSDIVISLTTTDVASRKLHLPRSLSLSQGIVNTQFNTVSDRELKSTTKATMSDTVASSSSDWVQLYEQSNIHGPATSSFGFSDARSVATSGASDIINPSSSVTSSTGDQTLTSKGFLPKPIKRRSRASKKTPTTLLNASTANFRALVQQFTGCPSISVGGQKGPINLNFGLGSAQNHSYAPAEMPPFDNGYYHTQAQMQQRQQPRQNVHQLHRDQGLLDNLPNSNAYFSVSNDLGPNLDMLADDGLLDMDDIALQELAKESFSHETMDNIDCF